MNREPSKCIIWSGESAHQASVSQASAARYFRIVFREGKHEISTTLSHCFANSSRNSCFRVTSTGPCVSAASIRKIHPRSQSHAITSGALPRSERTMPSLSASCLSVQKNPAQGGIFSQGFSKAECEAIMRNYACHTSLPASAAAFTSASRASFVPAQVPSINFSTSSRASLSSY